jgi:Amt family ammonium transporter
MLTIPRKLALLACAGVLSWMAVGGGTPVMAQEAPETPAVAEAAAEEAAAPTAADAVFTVNNLWMMIAAALVFIMHLGFATLESGLCRAKNTTNILFKNSLIPGIGILTYTLCGFNLMYPGFADGTGFEWFGFAGFGIGTDEAGITSAYSEGYTYWTDFFFQAMFAATAATIVSGAVAERIKLSTFLVFSTIFVAVSYPITGSWKWGMGWLHDRGFYDFAGSTIVHSVGGWGALAGVILLGPRKGKYLPNGKVKPIPGHSMPLATIGVFLLWLGWFGFNGGSVLTADPGAVSLVLVMTTLAASAGAVGAMITSWAWLKKPDLSMALNGILAGLVGITAGADQMGVLDSILIGAIAGAIVVVSVITLDKLKLDDPVGAISVHLVCGIWGTLAVALFGAMKGGSQFVEQLIGVVAVGVFTFIFAFVLFLILKAIMGLRVSEEEEVNGLDIGEHGQEAYPDFQPITES